jgi:hypothetical protein
VADRVLQLRRELLRLRIVRETHPEQNHRENVQAFA